MIASLYDLCIKLRLASRCQAGIPGKALAAQMAQHGWMERSSHARSMDALAGDARRNGRKPEFIARAPDGSAKALNATLHHMPGNIFRLPAEKLKQDCNLFSMKAASGMTSRAMHAFQDLESCSVTGLGIIQSEA